MTQTQNKTVGIVGLGLMGMALARRLSPAGFDVLGYDLDPDKGKALTGLGGRAAGSVAEVARACDRVLVAVMTTDQVETVVEGADGLIAAKPAGRETVVLCASTCEPGRVAALAERSRKLGLTLLDTPVSGTSDQVARGDGLGLIAGDETAAAAAADILDAVYPRRHYLGPAGDASRAKLAINLILGLNRLALAEGLVFAERLGLDTGAFLDVARDSAAYSQIMDVKGGKMLTADYRPPHGKIAQGLKDVTLMLEAAANAGQTLPLGGVLIDVLHGCVAHGQADWDNSSVIEEVRRRKA